MVSTEFWRRAQLSKDVLAILGALNAAASARMTSNDAETLRNAITMLDSAKNGALKIRKPDVSTKWALDTLRFRTAADAVSKLSAPAHQLPEFAQFLQNLQETLRALSVREPVNSEAVDAARRFFRALEDSVMRTLGTAQERAPARYL